MLSKIVFKKTKSNLISLVRIASPTVTGKDDTEGSSKMTMKIKAERFDDL